MATKAAYRRLTKEYLEIQKNPPPFITARPLESNILEWHYIIRGPPNTPYEGGEYYGRLTFPSEYPFKPPAIRMSTPSGRFQPDTRLCLTMSDFHPSLWNPSWSVQTILNGLLSFMTTDETTTGSIKTTDAEKRILAARSHKTNLKNSKYREAFPEFCTPTLPQLPNIPGQESTQKQQPALHARRKTTSMLATTDTPPRQGEAQSQPQTQPRQAMLQQSSLMRTMGQWRRWLLVVVVFVYLVISKLAARSTSVANNNGPL